MDSQPRLTMDRPTEPQAPGARVGPDAKRVNQTAPPLQSEFPPDPLAAIAEAVREAPPVERPRRPAEFVLRAVALVVDGCLLLFLWFFLFLLSGVAIRGLGLGRYFDSDLILIGTLITIALLYQSTELFGEATPGKVLVRLRVVGSDGNATLIKVRLRRWLVRVSPLLVACASIGVAVAAPVFGMDPSGAASRQIQNLSEALGCVSLLALAVLTLGTLGSLSPGGRALHDCLSGTAVFHADDARRAPGQESQGFPPVMSAETRGSPARSLSSDDVEQWLRC